MSSVSGGATSIVDRGFGFLTPCLGEYRHVRLKTKLCRSQDADDLLFTEGNRGNGEARIKNCSPAGACRDQTDDQVERA